MTPRTNIIMNDSVAVSVTSAFKRYSPNAVVLTGLNMTVKRGTIYGLLGPSGCGKTTLLSCILGRIPLDSGEIRLAINKKTQAGFMPQELTLNPEFTIEEIFNFYGLISGMKKEDIERRSAELIQLLELPPSNRFIQTCSGGQQRRISMAVTLLHDPELLILDEPTVGVDPLLNHKIWEYFKEAVQVQKKTIIITTHYIEEAKSANTIGLMRGGVLLAENTPTKLLLQMHCESLEQAFLKLSEKQEQETFNEKNYPEEKQKQNLPLTNKEIFSFRRFTAQLQKNYKYTIRNLPVTCFVLFIPAIAAMISCHSFVTLPAGVPIAWISNENCSVTFNNLTLLCPIRKPISCIYKNIMSSYYQIIEHTTLENGQKDVYDGRALGMFYFKPNFTENLLERLYWGDTASDTAIDMGTVTARADMTQATLSYGLLINGYAKMVNVMEEVMQSCGFDIKLAHTPLSVTEEMNNQTTMVTAILPGFIGSLMFYTTFMYTSSAIMVERTSGYLERAQLSGLTDLEILAAHFIMQIAVVIVSNTLLLLAIFQMTYEICMGSLALLYSILLLYECIGAVYGLVCALIIEQEILLIYSGIGTVLTVIITAGVIWPREGMNEILKSATDYIPFTPGYKSLFTVFAKGFSINHPHVYIGLINLIVFFLLLTLLVAILMNRRIIKF